MPVLAVVGLYDREGDHPVDPPGLETISPGGYANELYRRHLGRRYRNRYPDGGYNADEDGEDLAEDFTDDWRPVLLPVARSMRRLCCAGEGCNQFGEIGMFAGADSVRDQFRLYRAGWRRVWRGNAPLDFCPAHVADGATESV